jgi:hypothetical protein
MEPGCRRGEASRLCHGEKSADLLQGDIHVVNSLTDEKNEIV